MKKLLQHSLSAILMAAILSACSTSNDVVSNKALQKRKYNKGYYASFGKKIKPFKSENNKSEETKPNNNEFETSSDEMTVLLPIEEKDVLVEPKEIKQKEALASAMVSNNEPLNIKNYEGFIAINRIKEKGKSSHQYITKSMEEDHGGDHGFLVILLLIILCFILPPLAVILYEGPTTRFWLILILSLIAVFSLVYPFAWISGVIAVIWSLLIVIGAV